MKKSIKKRIAVAAAAMVMATSMMVTSASATETEDMVETKTSVASGDVTKTYSNSYVSLKVQQLYFGQYFHNIATGTNKTGGTNYITVRARNYEGTKSGGTVKMNPSTDKKINEESKSGATTSSLTTEGATIFVTDYFYPYTCDDVIIYRGNSAYAGQLSSITSDPILFEQ